MHYYKRHIGDYIKDTSHLSLLEHGIYARLLDVYYTLEGPIPDDQVARLIGARSPEEGVAMHILLREFFTFEDGCWRQARCDAELAKYDEKSDKAKKSAVARWKSCERNANALPTHSEGNADAMLTNNQEPITNKKLKDKAPKGAANLVSVTVAELQELGVLEDVANEFLALRKSKKATLTKIALDGIAKEATTAGLSLNDALRMCIVRGWRGFMAEWTAGKQVNGTTPKATRLPRDFRTLTYEDFGRQ